MMRILILGSGGRECTFAWKLAQDLPKDGIFIAPGNAGTSKYGTNVDLSTTDFENLAKFCTENNINTLLPGGEDSLVAGVRNYFESQPELSHIYVFGPDKDGAMLEGSKDFAKKFMRKYGIPTAAYQSFSKGEEQAAKIFLRTMQPPFVIKADGLAAGKGVVILETLAEADNCVDDMLANQQFGEASHTIVIEEFLEGIEVSFFSLTDGKNFILLPEAKDYKRIGEQDTGLNTGGMGAISPVAFVDDAFRKKVYDKVILPTMNGLIEENMNYKGFVFFGLINVKGEPYVIEYNCRMGDPETEVVMPRLKTSLADLIDAARVMKINTLMPQFDSDYCCTIVLVSGGYPEGYKKGLPISLPNHPDSLIFHSGTKHENNILLTNGGRVLAITSSGKTLEEALSVSFKTIAAIQFEGMYYRTDIGKDLLKYALNNMTA